MRPKQVQKITEVYEQPALVEAFIDGREFNVAVFDDDKPEALPVSEIDFGQMPEGQPRILQLRGQVAHRTTSSTRPRRPICPAPIDDALKAKLQETAVKAFLACECRDYARVDFRMDKKGRIFVLEVNPNPDISLNAGYARALGRGGHRLQVLLAAPDRESPGPEAEEMIRPMTPADRGPVLDLIRETGFFRPDEVGVAEELIDIALGNPDQRDYDVVVAEDGDGRVAGYMTWGPTPLTIGTYDLYWMAVAPKTQGRGHGKELVRWLEGRVGRARRAADRDRDVLDAALRADPEVLSGSWISRNGPHPGLLPARR